MVTWLNEEVLSKKGATMRIFRGMSMLWLLAIVTESGCNQQNSPVVNPAPGSSEASAKTEVAEAEHDHSGWWCVEHGIPEGECAQCDAKLAANFKKKGDWCEKHNRPDSQCFICHPELKEKFAAKYVTKFGKQPPPIEVESEESESEESEKEPLKD